MTTVMAENEVGEPVQKLGDLSNPDDQEIKLIESERVKEYYKRNYTWPLPLEDYKPSTEGWKQLMEERFHQIEQMEDRGERYEGFLQTTRTAMLVPNFTAHGFGLARCPSELLEALQTGIRGGLRTADYENMVDVIDGPLPPLFVNRPDLTQRVLVELKHYAETWAQIPLTPYRAYGFRLYQNQSQLHMHVDKVQTHIVSFILHIDSSEDAEPWPIFIEDFQGRTHEVILTPGDILFYESSKCFHGRPKRFNGGWYSSLFVHYYPSNGWFEQNHALEAHYAIPPSWGTTSTQPQVELPEQATEPLTETTAMDSSSSSPLEQQQQQQQQRPRKLRMIGTSMIEPDCPNRWCRSEESVQWSGPGKEGVWIAPTGETYPFDPQPVIWHEEL